MREHQIVISLKPEQFEEVQRLARAAGSKSISAFLRQQIIASLGLGNSAGPVAASASGPDMKQLTGELRRLHRELQIFVADSLPNNDYATAANAMEGSIPFPTAVQENFLTEGVPLIPESSYTQSLAAAADSYASAQTPIMPTAPMLPGQVSQALERGSMFSSSSFSLPTSSGYEDVPDGADPYSIAKQAMQANPVNSTEANELSSKVPPESAYSPRTAEQAVSSNAPYAIPPSSEQPPYAIPPTNNSAEAGFESTIPAQSNNEPSTLPTRRIAYTEPEAPPEPSPEPSTTNPQPSKASPQAIVPPPQPSSSGQKPQLEPQPPATQTPTSQSSAQQTVQSFAENDELEELADRAFAISPRLGPLSEAVRKFPDPLKDLLDEAFLNGLDDQEEGSGSNEEPNATSITESQTRTVVLEEELEDFNDGTDPSATPEQEHSEEEDPVTTEEAVSDEHSAQSDDAAEESDEPSQNSPPPSPPPISGGPPPRKRRT